MINKVNYLRLDTVNILCQVLINTPEAGGRYVGQAYFPLVLGVFFVYTSKIYSFCPIYSFFYYEEVYN